jgi:hypothetical protein
MKIINNNQALPWVRSIQRQRSNWSPTYILHLFHLEDTSFLFLFISESVKVYSNLFIWPSMWTRLEHAHCWETINNMWFLGKRETVNAWEKANFDGFRDIVSFAT